MALATARVFNLRTFQSLKIRDYRFHMLSGLFHMACMNMRMVVDGWFVYKLTGSEALLGLTLLANAIPPLVLSFLGGTLADRAHRKYIMIVCLILSSLLSLWIAVSTTAGIITWHYIVISSFIQGCIISFMMPARQSLINEIVGREHLMNAVALNGAVMNVNQIGAPAIAGFMVAASGIESVYYLMVGLFLVAAVLFLPMRAGNGAKRPSGQPRRSVMGDIKDGLVYVRSNQTLLMILILTQITVILAMPFRLLLPVFTEDILHVGPEKLGILVSVSGAGALVSSLIVASMGNKNRGIIFLHTGVFLGASIIAFSISGLFWMSLLIMIAAGFGQAARLTLSNTLLQSYTEDAYIGRVMSLFMMQWGVTSLGAFIVAIAAEFVGVQWAVGATGVMLVMVSFYCYAFAPRIRSLQ
ncbi:MAG: MFS transporter [SAR202 cluster bacterium]|nr:MFS transporter [SAR202 cluster bacterium]